MNSLRQQRLAMEGQALGRAHFTNCNLLHASNTANLEQTIPKILPELRTQTKFTKEIRQRYQHKQPNYLNVACIPFAQNFFSLDRYTELDTEAVSPEKSNGQYVSAFSEVEERQEKVEVGRRALMMAHRDFVNRRQLLEQRPIYGADLRRAVKVQLLLDDL